MSISLYSISNDFQTALSFDIDNEPDAEALCALLDEVQGRFEDKASNVVAYMRSVDAEAAAFETEEKRLKAWRQRLEKRSENLKAYLTQEMRRCSFTELKIGLGQLKFVKTPWSVDLDPTCDLPNDLLRFADPAPDKTAIKAALEAGRDIPGARLVQGERLRIS